MTHIPQEGECRVNVLGADTRRKVLLALGGIAWKGKTGRDWNSLSVCVFLIPHKISENFSTCLAHTVCVTVKKNKPPTGLWSLPVHTTAH